MIEANQHREDEVLIEGRVATERAAISTSDVFSPFRARFIGVKGLKLPELYTLPLDVTGFVVDDVSKFGLERVSFRLSDYENDRISLDCREYLVEQPPGYNVT